MKTRRLAVTVAALALACTPAEKKTPEPDVSTVDAYCVAYTTAWMDALGACRRATPAYRAAFVNALGGCPEDDLFVAAGRVRYSPVDAAACMQALRAAPCDGLGQAWYATAACRSVVAGTVAPGGACVVSDECIDGECEPQEACNGTCVAHLPAGADCSTGTIPCATGLRCDVRGTGTCVAPAPAALGQACGPTSLPCQAGLFCDAGVCRSKLVAGESCLYVGTLGSDPCAPGTFCEEWSDFGIPNAECVPWRVAGDVCVLSTGNGGLGSCAPGLSCSPYTGKCQGQPSLGQACDLNYLGDLPCLPGSWCDGGTCAAAKPAGADCTYDEECGWPLMGFCDAGTCAADPIACTP